MICEKCKQNPAKVHIIKIINGKKTSINLCEQCAKTYENIIIEVTKGKNINNLVSSLFETIHGQAENTKNNTGPKCGTCGLTLGGFRKSGRLGCKDCYSMFKGNLDMILEKVQGKTIHVGKIPHRSGGELRIKNQILNLKKELNDKVKKEEFEDAAVIRDEIKALENSIAGGDNDENGKQYSGYQQQN